MEKNELKEVSDVLLNKQKEANDILVGRIDELETKLVKNSERKESPKTVKGMILNALKSAEYSKMLKNDLGMKDLQLNAIHQPTNFTDGDAPVVLPWREAGVDKDTYAPTLVSDIISWGTASSNMIDWIERTSKTDSSEMRAENAIMKEGDLEYEEKSTKVKILSEFMKATNESLKDVNFLASEINSELLDDLKNLLETQLMSGDGTGLNLLGIIPQATASDMTSFAGTVDAANNADVLRVVLNQIYVAGKGRFTPTYILMHPTDVTTLDLLKITDGRYIDIPFYDGEKMKVTRVPIIQSTRVTLGDYLVGDFKRYKGFIRDSLSIRVFDQSEDDALYNRSTITANMRLATRLKTYDKPAFVKGTFATDIALLETP